MPSSCSRSQPLGTFLNQCSEMVCAGDITKTLNDVIADHPNRNLRGYDGYDSESIERADNGLMKVVYNAVTFTFLYLLRSFDRIITFEEILASSMDEDEDY